MMLTMRAMAVAAFLAVSASPSMAAETRCGYFVNPTPANAWLHDKDGEWIIASQGGHQADGDWPSFENGGQWVATNGSYGYGCACMSVTVDRAEWRVVTIHSATVKPLRACKKDPALKGFQGLE